MESRGVCAVCAQSAFELAPTVVTTAPPSIGSANTTRSFFARRSAGIAGLSTSSGASGVLRRAVATSSACVAVRRPNTGRAEAANFMFPSECVPGNRGRASTDTPGRTRRLRGVGSELLLRYSPR
jgi:hypothetical protein